MSHKPMTDVQKDWVNSAKGRKTDSGRYITEEVLKKDPKWTDRSTTQIKHETRDEALEAAGLSHKDYLDSKKKPDSYSEMLRKADMRINQIRDKRIHERKMKELEARKEALKKKSK